MKQFIRKDGYTIIKPEETHDDIPVVCPECDMVMTDSDDRLSYTMWTCCSWCERMWVQGRREKWLEGWRPERKVVHETLKGLGLLS